jgi:hypothetical protein
MHRWAKPKQTKMRVCYQSRKNNAQLSLALVYKRSVNLKANYDAYDEMYS